MAVEKGKKRRKDVYLKNNKELPIDVQVDYEPWQIEEIRKCREDIIYFAQNYFYIVHLDRGKELMQLYDPQIRAIKKIVENRNTIVCASRQCGKTSFMTVVCLWYALFNSNYNIAILANKEKMAMEILHRIKLAYRGLPTWLKSGVPEYTKESVVFSNESKIFSSTTSADSIRGQSINLLFLDEFAFVPPEIAEEFFASAVPTISSSKKSKIVIVSTPFGATGLYYNIFSKAEKGENGWAWEKMYWYELPDRDEQWKKDQLKMINHDMDKWNQEYELQFLNNGQTALNAILIKRMKEACLPAPESFDDGTYLLWEEPKPNRIITIGVDISEGVGQDYSVSQILDITNPTDIKHCGVFATNTLKPYEYAEKLNQIVRSWGRPFLCIERNGPGGQVVDAMLNVHGYDNIVSVSKVDDAAGRYKEQIGIICHQNNKLAGNTNMRYYLETLECVHLRDIKTVTEFETYVRKTNGRSWGAMKGYNDDRIMALIWALFLLEKTVANKYLDILEYDETGQVISIADPNQDIANQLLESSGPKKIAYARLGNQPPPSLFQFGSMPSYRDAEISDYMSSGFKFV
jgi:hypothetical protein